MDRNLKIGIIGLGLIGGSIFKALCALKFDVYSTTRSQQTINKAKKYSNNVFRSNKHLKDCDLIFVCAPMRETLEILDELDTILDDKNIVTDVCSLKRFLCNKKRNYQFIPSHPMAGTEFSGFDNSFESLFQGAKWVLTPSENTDKDSISKLKSVIEILGAKSVFATPDEHDEAVALISHMPMLISQAIFKTAKENKLAMKLAASGFRDMTRLAMSNQTMACDMVNLNKKNIKNSLKMLNSAAKELLSGDYESMINDISSDRQVMYQDGKNIL